MSLRLAALCGLLAPVAFTVGWVAGVVAQPDAYDLVNDAVSDLGALTADQAWIYNRISGNLTGLLVVALACGLWKARRSGLEGKAGVIALAVMGVSQFFDGWFRLDCRGIDAGCDNGGTSWHAVAHQVESLVTLSGMFVSVFALAYAFTRSERWRDLRVPTLIAGFTSLTTIVGLMFVGGGIAARVGVTVWFAWVALVSYRLLTIARDDARSAAQVSP